jgi:hypothetical protein
MTNPPQTLCQQRLTVICNLVDTHASHDVPMKQLDELLSPRTSPTTWMCRSTPSIGGGIEAGVRRHFGSASTSATGETTSNSGSSCSFKTRS